MRLVFALEHRFDRTPDGRIWTQATYRYQFWERYLDIFERVQVVSRVRDVAIAPLDSVRADSEQVSFLPLPCYVGPEQYLLNMREVAHRIRSWYADEDCFIARGPGAIGTRMIKELAKREHPYGLEVVGDPRDVFSPDAVQHPLRPLFRWWFSRNLERQCARAAAAAYVTEYALQHRYPCPAFTVGVSDVELPGAAFASEPRCYSRTEGALNLIFVGSLAQQYKAPHILIDATAACVAEGLDLQLVIVGDGKLRGELEARARNCGMGDKVKFLGQVPAGAPVREQLDDSDLFVLPSYTEGMPRAMLEAMARGLPCIGTTVGGIPELLAEEDMVPPGDARALADKIRGIARDPGRLSMMSERNLEKAGLYSDRLLKTKRTAFYKYLRDVTQTWLSQKKDS